MKGSNFILVIATFVFVSIFALALVPDDFWEHDIPLAEHSQLPQIAANNKNNHLARNNTNPAINSVINGAVDKNRAVNSGINFNSFMQPVAQRGQFAVNGAQLSNNATMPNQTALLPNNKFSFASRHNSLGLTQANPTSVFNNVALNNVALNNVALNNNTSANNPQLDIRTGPPILSDAFPPPSHDDGRNRRSCSLCHLVTRTSMTAKERMFNNQTQLSTKTLTYQGMIQQVSNQKAVNGWNRVHIWLRSQNGQAQEIILSPNWFLDFVGCPVSKQQIVSGVAFEVAVDKNARRMQTTALYAKNVKIDGTLCRLRSDEGLPLWSN